MTDEPIRVNGRVWRSLEVRVVESEPSVWFHVSPWGTFGPWDDPDDLFTELGERIRERALIGAHVYDTVLADGEEHDQLLRGAANAAVRMAQDVLRSHVMAVGIDRSLCMCGHRRPCPMAVDARDILNRYANPTGGPV